VERVRITRGVRHLLVRWKGEPAASPTWEECRKVGLVQLDGCIALRPRPVYMRVHDSGCKATSDTYGSLRYIYLQLPNIL
jgi:hypothetical protein